MDWLEIKVYTTTEGIEHVAGVVLMFGINGYTVEDKNDFKEFLNQTTPHWDYVDEKLNRLYDVETSVTFYLENNDNSFETLKLLKSELDKIKQNDFENKLGRLEIEINKIKQCDWEEGWKKYFKPFNVGENMMIVPTWEKAEANGRKIITIDPGMSFETGQHHTTKLCIEALERYVTNECSVLDLGSGSGILSIAALVLGAKSAKAVDIDPFAVKVSVENAALNNFFADKYNAFAGDILTDNDIQSKIDGKYDIITANIVADVLIAFAPCFKKYMNEKSVLICSGIIEHRFEDVRNELVSNGYTVLNTNKKSEWYEVELKIKTEE